ncbi:MAG: formyltetrahydrofolate deformylase [Cytophagales bacterium]|nr:formyltetrahydrofolate deformylase [Cytophagales bacterium]
MTSSASHILLVDCPDERGLIFRITQVISSKGLNIYGNREFVDDMDHFFMRSEIIGALHAEQIIQELQNILPATATIRLFEKRKKKIVVLATKEHHCLSDLLVRNHFGDLPIEIQGVISNYDTLRDFTERLGIEFTHIPAEGMSREEHEREVMAAIRRYSYDYLVLAKYMRILSPWFVAEFKNQIINIHHSFLPAFVGANPYKQAYERGVKLIGATAHFVNNDLDEGPIIAQSIIPVNHTYNATEMRKAGRDVEKIVLATALKNVVEDRVFVRNNKTVLFD